MVLVLGEKASHVVATGTQHLIHSTSKNNTTQKQTLNPINKQAVKLKSNKQQQNRQTNKQMNNQKQSCKQLNQQSSKQSNKQSIK